MRISDWSSDVCSSDLAISVYFPEKTAPPAHAQMVDIVAGDATGSLDLVSPRRARASGVVSGLAIGGSAATRVLVTFGDSITEGAGATPGKAMSWPAQLGRMLDRKSTRLKSSH